MGRDNIEYLMDVAPEEILELWPFMTPEEQQLIDGLLRNTPSRPLMPHQMVPHELDWWEGMLLVGGRGVGKTVTGAFEARNHLRKYGKAARIGIGAPTNADARDTCMEGDTGLITMFPNEFKYYNRSLGEARHIDGGFVKAMGTEKPKRWNGPQWTMLWFDELALCQQAAWDDANLGLRLGKRPYWIATTTPKNKKWVKALALDKTTYVPQYIDKGLRRLPTTFDNKFLPGRRVAWLKNKFGGSRLGRQELEGVFLDDIEGAMVKRAWIDDARRVDPDSWPRMVRVVVGVDPAGSQARKTADKNALTEEQRQNQSKNAQTAICVMGLGEDGRLYILNVKAEYWGPSEWAKEVLRMFHQYRADNIIVERNYGGAMVEETIRNQGTYEDKALGRMINAKTVPVKTVVASTGKHVRFQPIATLYEQGRVVHCGEFAEAEDQLCAFVDADDNEGADMVDAIAWAGTELGGFEYAENSIIVGAGHVRLRNFVTRF